MELSSPKIRKFLILLGLIPFFYFLKKKKKKKNQEIQLSFIFFKKVVFIFWERYIQNIAICRTRSIFRALVYSEPKAYSEHCQTSKMERFAKIAT